MKRTVILILLASPLHLVLQRIIPPTSLCRPAVSAQPFHPAIAEAVSDKPQMPSPKANDTKYTRYGHQPFTQANPADEDKAPASTFKTEESPMRDIKANVHCEALPDYPVEGGVSGVFTGVHHGKLIVAGGCNFPGKPAKDGGEKVFYDDVYLLDISAASNNKGWVRCQPFPRRAAYGAAVSTDEGIVCIGGQNKTSALSDVVLMQYDTKAGVLRYAPLPPLPVSQCNGSAALLGDVVYVAGGMGPGADKGAVYFLDLKNKQSGWGRIDCPEGRERQQPVLVAQAGTLFLAGGYDEQTPEVFTDVMKFDFGLHRWVKFTDIKSDGENLRTFVGASGTPFETGKILFAGGVDYERFDSALKRIKRVREAIDSQDDRLVAELRDAGREYMEQSPGWYRFGRELTFLDVHTGRWHSSGNYEELARAGAGIVLWDNRLYIVCGELKPGVRTTKVNRFTIAQCDHP